MAKYVTTRCGYCKSYWEVFAPAGSSSVGSPIIKCRNCLGLNKSDKKLYRDLNLSQKILFWAGSTIGFIIYGFGGIAGGLFIIKGNNEKIIAWVIGIILIIFGALSIYALFKIKGSLKSLEHEFDENGGFIWSGG